jgi:tRNA (guanine37-N1)-methyltransferase
MRFDILTIFPDFFQGPLNFGVLKRAIVTEQVAVATHDLRSFTKDRHRTVDDRPFGGGEGMVLKPEPIYDCFQSLGITPKPERDTTKETVVLLSAQGKPFTQTIAQELSRAERVVFLCGRYEGIDERINQLLCDRELSIGDYILSGGELAAAVILDSVVRLLPGVLGNPDSIRFESFGAEVEPGKPQKNAPLPLGPDGVPSSTHLSGGLLDYPHYTRPAEFLGLPIPEVLQNGNHDAIRQWRRRMALEKTRRNRPDLLAHATLTRKDREFLRLLDDREQKEHANKADD